jgi:ubiquinone/menaquinone biosynthesis C-methylase UbiE
MSTDPIERRRRIWDQMAPRYDRGMRRLEPLLFGRDTRAQLCRQATGEVLEVAIGTGLNLPHYPPGIRLTGIDLSPAMLTAAGRRAAELGMTVDLREAPAERIIFDDHAFDTVVCTLSLCSVADDATAIAEMYRVLRPGGQLLLLDHVAVTNPILLALQRLWEKFTLRMVGDYQTRHPLPFVRQTGFTVADNQRGRLGTIERVRAVKPS